MQSVRDQKFDEAPQATRSCEILMTEGAERRTRATGHLRAAESDELHCGSGLGSSRYGVLRELRYLWTGLQRPRFVAK